MQLIEVTCNAAYRKIVRFHLPFVPMRRHSVPLILPQGSVVAPLAKWWTLSLILSLERLNASADPVDYVTVCVTHGAT